MKKELVLLDYYQVILCYKEIISLYKITEDEDTLYITAAFCNTLVLPEFLI